MFSFLNLAKKKHTRSINLPYNDQSLPTSNRMALFPLTIVTSSIFEILLTNMLTTTIAGPSTTGKKSSDYCVCSGTTTVTMLFDENERKHMTANAVNLKGTSGHVATRTRSFK